MSAAALKMPQTYSPIAAKNFEALESNNLSAKSDKPLAFTISQRDLTDGCRDVMWKFVGANDNAAKRLAKVLECSIGTAKNYLEGRTTPQGIHDARAMAVIPGYLKWKLKLAGAEIALDPEHQAEVAKFMRYCAIAADKMFNKEEVAQ